MKLGFFTAAFPDNTLASRWPNGAPKAASRPSKSPAGPTKKPPAAMPASPILTSPSWTQAQAKEIRAMLDGYGLTISSLGYYPNPLHPDPEHRETVIDSSEEGDRSGGAAGNADRRHLCRQRQKQDRPAKSGRLCQDLAADCSVRR